MPSGISEFGNNCIYLFIEADDLTQAIKQDWATGSLNRKRSFHNRHVKQPLYNHVNGTEKTSFPGEVHTHICTN